MWCPPLYSLAKPQQSCSTFEARSIKATNMNCFRSIMLTSEEFTGPKFGVDDFAEQLQQRVIGVVDKLASLKRITKRCGKPTDKWLASVALLARRCGRQLKRRYRRSRTDAPTVVHVEPPAEVQIGSSESRRKHFATTPAETANDDRKRWKIIKIKPAPQRRTDSKKRCSGAAEDVRVLLQTRSQ